MALDDGFSHGILGSSASIRDLLDLVRKVAPSDLPVHIRGETGSGKEKVARAVHGYSPRRRGPFVAVNAACLGEGLFESELFGHSKGAFTGAVIDRRGLAAEAEGGTLFIDEVSELAPGVQAKLLRFLQEGEYRRLGDSGLRRGNVRIVSAANGSLEQAVERGTFRRDLLYRLCAVALEVPTLRARIEDIEVLTDHFVRAFASRLGRRPPTIDARAWTALRQHPWPGNVRELENVLARAVLLCDGSRIDRDDLAPALRLDRAEAGAPARLREETRALEKARIRDELARCGGRRADAARVLGLSRQALHAKMRRLFPEGGPL